MLFVSTPNLNPRLKDMVVRWKCSTSHLATYLPLTHPIYTYLYSRVKTTNTNPAKSKKIRRKVAKQQRKLEAARLASGDLSSLQPKIPLTQQSIDLPANEEGSLAGALEADAKREELREAMRRERRAKIKEANFLKGM